MLFNKLQNSRTNEDELIKNYDPYPKSKLWIRILVHNIFNIYNGLFCSSQIIYHPLTYPLRFLHTGVLKPLPWQTFV